MRGGGLCFNKDGSKNYISGTQRACMADWIKADKNRGYGPSPILEQRESRDRRKAAALAAKYPQQQVPVAPPQQQSSFFSYLNPVAAVQNISNAAVSGLMTVERGLEAGVGAIGQGLYNGTTTVTDATGITNIGQTADVNAKLLLLKNNLPSSCKLVGEYNDQAGIDLNNCVAKTKQIRQSICPVLRTKSLEMVCDDSKKCTTVGAACAAGGARKKTRRNKTSKKSATKKHKKSRSKKSNKKRSTKKKK